MAFSQHLFDKFIEACEASEALCHAAAEIEPVLEPSIAGHSLCALAAKQLRIIREAVQEEKITSTSYDTDSEPFYSKFCCAIWVAKTISYMVSHWVSHPRLPGKSLVPVVAALTKQGLLWSDAVTLSQSPNQECQCAKCQTERAMQKLVRNVSAN